MYCFSGRNIPKLLYFYGCTVVIVEETAVIIQLCSCGGLLMLLSTASWQWHVMFALLAEQFCFVFILHM